jgi:hypothetical protein
MGRRVDRNQGPAGVRKDRTSSFFSRSWIEIDGGGSEGVAACVIVGRAFVGFLVKDRVTVARCLPFCVMVTTRTEKVFPLCGRETVYVTERVVMPAARNCDWRLWRTKSSGTVAYAEAAECAKRSDPAMPRGPLMTQRGEAFVKVSGVLGTGLMRSSLSRGEMSLSVNVEVEVEVVVWVFERRFDGDIVSGFIRREKRV